MRVIYTGVRCRVQIHRGTRSARRKARESPSTPPTTVIGGDHPAEMAGVGSKAVSTPRPEAEVMPSAGNPGGVQNWFCWGSKGLAVVPHSEYAVSPGPTQGGRRVPSRRVQHRRVAGPLQPDLFPQVHPNRFGVIPKGRSGKWRLIEDMSFPAGSSVNDGINESLCSLTYVGIGDAVKGIAERGKGTQLAKVDVKSAYRNVPVHPDDRWLMGMFCLSRSTVKNYLAAVRHSHIALGLGDSKMSVMVQLEYVIRGMKRQSQAQKRIRLPISLDILEGMRRIWLGYSNTRDAAILWAAASYLLHWVPTGGRDCQSRGTYVQTPPDVLCRVAGTLAQEKLTPSVNRTT